MGNLMQFRITLTRGARRVTMLVYLLVDDMAVWAAFVEQQHCRCVRCVAMLFCELIKDAREAVGETFKHTVASFHCCRLRKIVITPSPKTNRRNDNCIHGRNSLMDGDPETGSFLLPLNKASVRL